MNAPEPQHGPTPGMVVAGGLAAGSGHLMLWLLFGATGNPALFALAGLIAYGGVFAILASRLGSEPAPLLGLVPSSPLAIPAVLLLLPSLLLTSEIDNWVRASFMSESLRELLEQAAEQRGSQTGLLRTAELILIEVLVFPIALELFFRGMVQPVLVERFGPARGIASAAAVEIGAVLLTTLSPYGKLEAFTAALLLGALRHSSGSLLPAFALRALMGAATVAAGHGVFGIPGFDDLDRPHTPANWLIAGAVCVGLGLWLCARMGRYRHTTGA